jgi:uncharacterized protein
MKKISKYTRYYILDNIHILYNMISDCTIALENDIFLIFYENRHNLEAICSIKPDLYAALERCNIVVDSGICEETSLVESWHRSDLNPENIKLTILPTLQCNLRCWYCYEDHNNSSKLDRETTIGIQNLIKRVVVAPHLKKLNLDFFGGEPLMFFGDKVAPIIMYANAVCAENNKRLGISFTSNGTLLTDEVCSVLADTSANVSFQITLDGDKERHNQVRHLSNNVPTYDMIIGNIKRAIKNGFYVSVRFNYTHKNYSTYASVMADFDDLIECEKPFIDFSFHKVWQEMRSSEMESTIFDTIHQYAASGYSVNMPNSFGNKDRCYADSPNNLIINHNGDVYKCTARDFTPESKEGSLQSDGTIIWNERYRHRMTLIYGTTVCQQCEIFPICNCGCSQNRIECHSNAGECPLGYSLERKENFVRDRVYALLSRFVTNQLIK